MDVAVRRAVVTGVSQTCGELQIRQIDDMMWDVVDTTAHMGARPSHAVWQGGRFSYKGRNNNYPDFESSTGYGSAGGLKGINCRHDFYPAVDGSPRMYSQAQLDEWANHKVIYNGVEYTDYEAGQIQRRMERGIRAGKRTLTGLDAGITAAPNDAVRAALKDEFGRESLRQKNRNSVLSDFLEQTGRKMDHSRTQVQEFGRPLSGKASAAAKKELQNRAQSGIMEMKGVNNMHSGGLSGALNPNSERAMRHAERYYAEVRKMTTDCNKIAQATGWKESSISQIKDHLFYKKHNLGGLEAERFDADYDIAVSWQNLIEGRIEAKDLVLLKHEYLELHIMKSKKVPYAEAHKLAEAKHNYGLALKEWRMKL